MTKKERLAACLATLEELFHHWQEGGTFGRLVTRLRKRLELEGVVGLWARIQYTGALSLHNALPSTDPTADPDWEGEVAKLRAILDAPQKVLFADGREPTTNERQMLNLLQWRQKEAAEAKEELDRLQQASNTDLAAALRRWLGDARAATAVAEDCCNESPCDCVYCASEEALRKAGA